MLQKEESPSAAITDPYIHRLSRAQIPPREQEAPCLLSSLCTTARHCAARFWSKLHRNLHAGNRNFSLPIPISLSRSTDAIPEGEMKWPEKNHMAHLSIFPLACLARILIASFFFCVPRHVLHMCRTRPWGYSLFSSSASASLLTVLVKGVAALWRILSGSRSRST